VFDTAADAVVLLDASGVIVAVNLATMQMFRCNEAQLVGTPALKWIPARHRARHLADMRALATGQVASVTRGWVDVSHAMRFDGEEFPIEVTKSEIALAGQRLQTMTIRDVSMRQQLRDAVFNSRAKLAAALASMRDAVFISNAAGSAVEFNDGFVEFHRFKTRQECDTTLAELVVMFDVMTAEGALLAIDQWPVYRALRGESCAGVDLKVRRKDSGSTWIGSYTFAPIRDEYGAITGAVLTARDVTAERAMLEELTSSRAELRRLVASQNCAAENERKRIALELHDDLQQTLAALRLNVAAVEQHLKSVSSDATAAAAEALALSESAILSTRRIISGLRPQILDDLGLLDALAATLSDFSERHGIKSDFDVVGEADAVLSAEVATCLYRITQEALQNIGKHAQASCVVCTLDLSDPHRAVLQIHDDGVGIRPADLRKRECVGVLGMDERVRCLGGNLRVMPGVVSGTTVEAVVPCLRGRM
jgi:PAS domain S-box-containing protein